jgi:hypothetical protein
MSHPPPTLDETRLRAALITVLDHALPACAGIEYCLVGTAAALLQGVSLPAADVDLLVKERRGVDAFAAALSPFKCLEPPAWLPEMRQYYANFEVEGIEVGISTVEIESVENIFETFGPGPWQHFRLLACGPYSVPAVALELRLITELYRDRPDRSQPLIQFMQAHGCDVDLVARGMAAAGLPQAVQADVLRRLEAI